MIKGKVLTLAVVGVMMYAAAQTLVYTDIPVSIELARQVESTPAVLDHGRIDLGLPAIVSTVHVRPNGASSLWCSVLDGPGGWVLGPEAGPDTYAVEVNGIPMTADPQQVFPLVGAYDEASVSFYYYAPLADTVGAGVNQGYVIRVEARETTTDPGTVLPGGD